MLFLLQVIGLQVQPQRLTCESRIKVRGIAKNLYFRMGTNLRTTPTTFTLRKNKVDTALTVTYAAGETGIKEDTTNQVQYEVGDHN